MKNFLKALGFFVLALGFVVLASWLSGIVSPSTEPSSSVPTTTPYISVKPIVSCSPDRLSYSVVTQKVKLIDSQTAMFAADGKFVNSQVIITKSETANSKVACGYLFVRAGTENIGALKTWEDVYINPNMFGGHLSPTGAISINDGQMYSEYLYSLDKITYWASSARKDILQADWAALLNVSDQVNFNIALNTNNQNGFIDEITIAYKCWDPSTGEENTECKLQVKSATETQSNGPVR